MLLFFGNYVNCLLMIGLSNNLTIVKLHNLSYIGKPFQNLITGLN